MPSVPWPGRARSSSRILALAPPLRVTGRSPPRGSATDIASSSSARYRAVAAGGGGCSPAGIFLEGVILTNAHVVGIFHIMVSWTVRHRNDGRRSAEQKHAFQT
jgi:hypothetical protein